MGQFITTKFVGADIIQRTIAALGSAYTSESATADLLAAAPPVVSAAVSNVGYGPPDLHLRDNIVAVPDPEAAKAGGLLAMVVVGARNVAKIGTFFYDKFLEFGTVKMSPRPWLRPAGDQTESSVRSSIVEAVRKRLSAAVK